MMLKTEFLHSDSKLKNLYYHKHDVTTTSKTQEQTADAFSNKWQTYDHNNNDFKVMEKKQKQWFLQLYGFNSEQELQEFLQSCTFIIDAGCGLGYKAAWFAQLNPGARVLGVDISEAVISAAHHYQNLENLSFVKSDIACMPFVADAQADFVLCDQVIHHTANPVATSEELARVTDKNGQLGLYVYRKKALPRELLDEHFRSYSKTLSHEELLSLSEQLTELGKILDDVDVELHFPKIPALDIDGGKMSLQRFIYWNFIKCYWNPEQGYENSKMINYDWYAPSQAQRYTDNEFNEWMSNLGLKPIYRHVESACISGRFRK